MVRQIKNKFRTRSKPIMKTIDPSMVKVVKRLQQDLQRKENIEFGKRSQTVTFQFATMVMGRRLSR
jgi:hypothetical protein